MKSLSSHLKLDCNILTVNWWSFYNFIDLHRLTELQEFPIDLEPYVKKLMNSRRRVMLVNNILQNAQVLPVHNLYIKNKMENTGFFLKPAAIQSNSPICNPAELSINITVFVL